MVNIFKKATERLFNSKQKMQDSVTSRTSGAGGTGDRTLDYTVAPGLLDSKGIHWRNSDDYFYTMWRRYWEARKIVNIPAYDMTKEGWVYSNLDVEPEITEAIEKEAERLKVRKVIYKALEYERKYGGSIVILGTAELREDENASEPLSPDKIGKKGLVFLRAIPRHSIAVLDYEQDPFSVDYAMPVRFTINDREIHKSRMLIFDGGGEDDARSAGYSSDFRNRNDGFGYSVLEPLYDDIIRSVGTRKAAFQLVNNASIMMFKRDAADGTFQDISDEGEEQKQKIKNVLDQISIYRAAMLGSGEDLSNYSASFGSTPELIMSYLQVLSAASDIPTARFLGESPGGLNATGKGELKNYYDSIHAKQEVHLKPQLEKLMPYLCMSALGRIIPDYSIEFNPIDQTSELEKSEMRVKDWSVISSAVSLGVGDDKWAADEARERDIFLNDPSEIKDDIDMLEATNEALADGCGYEEWREERKKKK